MAVAPSLLYRGTLTTTNATLKTTDAIATTVVTSIVATNRSSTAGWFTVTVNGFYLAYQMPVAGNQTVTIDVKQVTGLNVVIQGLANAGSTIDLSISGVVSTGPSDQAWTAYTPTLTASTTNPTNWTAYGAYSISGKTVHCKMRFVASASVTVGSGTYRFSLPVNAVSGSIPIGPAMAYAFDSSATSIYHPRISIPAAQTYIELWYPATWGGSNVPVTNSAPFAWAVNDEFGIALTYEAA